MLELTALLLAVAIALAGAAGRGGAVVLLAVDAGAFGLLNPLFDGDATGAEGAGVGLLKPLDDGTEGVDATGGADVVGLLKPPPDDEGDGVDATEGADGLLKPFEELEEDGLLNPPLEDEELWLIEADEGLLLDLAITGLVETITTAMAATFRNFENIGLVLFYDENIISVIISMSTIKSLLCQFF